MAGSHRDGKGTRSVFVGNISWDATEQELIKICEEVGPVVSFRLVLDRETNLPKGFGFCEYRDEETAASARRNLQGYKFKGRQLRFDVAEGSRPAWERGDRGGRGWGAAGGGFDASRPPPSAPGTPHEGPPPRWPDVRTLSAAPVGLPAALAAASAMASILGGGGPDGGPGSANGQPPPGTPDALTSSLANMSSQQLYHLLMQLKGLTQQDASSARTMLTENPPLAKALFQAQIILGMVKPGPLPPGVLSQPPPQQAAGHPLPPPAPHPPPPATTSAPPPGMPMSAPMGVHPAALQPAPPQQPVAHRPQLPPPYPPPPMQPPQPPQAQQVHPLPPPQGPMGGFQGPGIGGPQAMQGPPQGFYPGPPPRHHFPYGAGAPSQSGPPAPQMPGAHMQPPLPPGPRPPSGPPPHLQASAQAPAAHSPVASAPYATMPAAGPYTQHPPGVAVAAQAPPLGQAPPQPQPQPPPQPQAPAQPQPLLQAPEPLVVSLDVEQQKVLLAQVVNLTPEQILMLPPEQRQQVLELQHALKGQ